MADGRGDSSSGPLAGKQLWMAVGAMRRCPPALSGGLRPWASEGVAGGPFLAFCPVRQEMCVCVHVCLINTRRDSLVLGSPRDITPI